MPVLLAAVTDSHLDVDAHACAVDLSLIHI